MISLIERVEDRIKGTLAIWTWAEIQSVFWLSNLCEYQYGSNILKVILAITPYLRWKVTVFDIINLKLSHYFDINDGIYINKSINCDFGQDILNR